MRRKIQNVNLLREVEDDRRILATMKKWNTNWIRHFLDKIEEC